MWTERVGLSVLLVLVGLWLARPVAPHAPVFLVEVAGDVPAPGIYALAQPERALALSTAGAPALVRGPVHEALHVEGNRVREVVAFDPPLLGRALDLNEAPARALTTIPGVGPGRAAAIVDFRERNGPFYSVSEARWVRGIGPHALSDLAPWVSVADRGPRPVRPVDLNADPVERLQRLPRVGPVLAARIVAHRPYRDVADVQRVPGIGAGTVARWGQQATVGGGS